MIMIKKVNLLIILACTFLLGLVLTVLSLKIGSRNSSTDIRAKASLSQALGMYDWNCLRSLGCITLPDRGNAQPKTGCYKTCRKTNPANGLKDYGTTNTIIASVFREREKAYMNEYANYYRTTNYGELRKKVVEGEVGSGYFRIVCNTMAVAILMALERNAPIEEIRQYENRIMSVFDDYNYWNNPNSANPVTAYSCGIAASLLWDKWEDNIPWDKTAGKYPRSAKQKKAQIAQILTDFASRVITINSPKQMIARHQSGKQSGNSQAEETAWNAAFLSLAGQLFPSKKFQYEPIAKELGNLSVTACSDWNSCMFTQEFTMINHNWNPNIHYAFSTLMSLARASMPYYIFGGYTRDAVPKELKGQGVSDYTLTNIFESNLRFVNPVTLGYQGNYVKDGVLKRYEDNSYLNYTGIIDWGNPADYNISGYALLYMVDQANWNGYRSNVSPYWYLTQAETKQLADKTLYFPPVFRDGAWRTEPLVAAKYAKIVGILDTTVADIDIRTNTHFFLNSVKAFDHLVSYLLLGSSNPLHRME
jgi:hypothetical protein